MTAAEIILEANRRGVVLVVRNGQIIARPAGALPPEIKVAAQQHKAELLGLLTGSDLTPRDRDDHADHVVETVRTRLDGENYGGESGIDWGYGLYRSTATDAERIAQVLPTGPARCLIRMCREHGIGLRLEPDGTLVLQSNGRAWRGLVAAIEAHVDDVAALVAQGWDGTDS